MSHDPQSPSDAADHEDNTYGFRSYTQGRNANLAGENFRDAANGDWQAGWLDAQDDRGLCE